MYWNEGDSSVAVMPTAEPAKSMQPSWCTGGNPQMGQNATQVTADWANTITAEMADMVTAANVTLDKTKNNQVRIANNMRGWFVWDADTDYTGEKSFCLGTDGIPYRAVQNSGPGTEAGYIDPVTDTAGAYWETLASWINGAGSLPPIDLETLETNFYIRADGNDDNDGLEDNAEHAFRTLQGAVDKYLLRYKASPYPVKFKMTVAGEYGPAQVNAAAIGAVYIQGVESNSESAVTGEIGSLSGTVNLNNIKVTRGGVPNSNIVGAGANSTLVVGNVTIESDVSNSRAFYCAVNGRVEFLTGTVKLKGQFDRILSGNSDCVFQFGKASSGWGPITIDFTSATATVFIRADLTFNGFYFYRNVGTITFVGNQANISKKYQLGTLCGLLTFGGGANFIPGTNAGTLGTNSVYS